ncbi:MAG: T9SS type A sorting domain-containing protein [Ginsengibacter sp.]
MKQSLLILFLLGFINFGYAQITTSIIKANFGVEGDLEANYYNNNVLSGNDDWFNKSSAAYSGRGVIDTTGSAEIRARYAIDPDFRRLPFYRTMNVPSYSVVNNHMWIDALFIRDYHLDDSTVFQSGASKNGNSPADWSTPVAQSVPDKNDILDMMVHVRRAGPDIKDSLWLFGGLSLESTSGNRYFDFEMYQTDIYYDRPTLKFYGYGPDAGHTSWKFDASGNVTVPGDIIFSAEYGGSSLSKIEARIWIDRSALLITPAGFSWSGSFDGATNGSQFGYAGIIPKTFGNFFTGTENKSSEWAGDFQLVRGNNQVVSNYLSGQFMEFSVNLTKLGLDPVTLLGGNNCEMPFRRILVKTRASSSFTAVLKDFVGPFDFFRSPKVEVESDLNSKCGLMTVGQLSIINPVTTSVYTWSTTDGRIASYNPDNSITVDSAGTYVVTQQLQSGCSIYATDTIVVFRNPLCYPLQNSINDFAGKVSNNQVLLNWSANSNPGIDYFKVEKSTDGFTFTSLEKIEKKFSSNSIIPYYLTDEIDISNGDYVYYRLKTVGENGEVVYSRHVRIFLGEGKKVAIGIAPNPARDVMRLEISSPTEETAVVTIYDFTGRQMRNFRSEVPKGRSNHTISDFQNWPKGIYSVKVLLGKKVFIEKMVLVK